jgi:hypothetical protein
MLETTFVKKTLFHDLEFVKSLFNGLGLVKTSFNDLER